MGDVAAIHNEDGDHADEARGAASRRRVADYTVAQAKTTASRIVAVGLVAAGLSQRATSDACGVSRNLVQWWADPEHPRTMPLGRLLVLAQVSRRGKEAAIAILTAALSHVQDECCPTATRRDLRGLIDDLHAELGDVACEWRTAIADGEVSPAEARAMLPEIADVERVLAQIRHELSKIAEVGK